MQLNNPLDIKIQQIFERHKARYGARRITEDLKADGEQVSKNRVARRMKVLNLKAKQARKFKVTRIASIINQLHLTVVVTSQ